MNQEELRQFRKLADFFEWVHKHFPQIHEEYERVEGEDGNPPERVEAVIKMPEYSCGAGTNDGL